MYICVHIYIYIYTYICVCMYIYIYIYIIHIYLSIYLYISISIYLFVYLSLSLYIYGVYLSIYLFLSLSPSLSLYIYIYIYVCIYIYIYIYICNRPPAPGLCMTQTGTPYYASPEARRASRTAIVCSGSARNSVFHVERWHAFRSYPSSSEPCCSFRGSPKSEGPCVTAEVWRDMPYDGKSDIWCAPRLYVALERARACVYDIRIRVLHTYMSYQ